MFAVFNCFSPAYAEAARDLGATPMIYALGTVTTVVSFAVMGITLGAVALLSGMQKRQRRARG